MVVATAVISKFGDVLAESFSMFWETLWALVLGFTLSGVVQAFVPRSTLQQKLGDHGPKATLRASLYGMASSSCSYAASAMSKSLFSKGADFLAAMVFMIASTNLVLELGVVLLVLLGWQFMAAEFVGGPIMIFLLVAGGGLLFTKTAVAAARKRVEAASSEAAPDSARTEELEATRWSVKLRSAGAWADASNYAVADVTMLRKELVIGYLVAGGLAVLMPTSAWHVLFFHGHGIWTTLENVLVGPLIAVLSWVCSIGNVPLAAALWSGGLGFGGVVAFIFADLISMPLLLIYVKFYGRAMTLRIFLAFYASMVLAGLMTEGIFSALHAVPSSKIITLEASRPSWNYTTWLNFLALIVAGGVWYLARNRARFGGGTGYGIDPVCGMQVRLAEAPASTTYKGRTIVFCADRCKERFLSDPERFLSKDATHEPMEPPPPERITLGRKPAMTEGIDPICGMTVQLETAAATRMLDGVRYGFCNPGCAEKFDQQHGSSAATP